MNGLSVIIPSKTATNLAPCVRAIWRAEDKLRVIVVDDGIEWDAYDQHDASIAPPDEVAADRIRPFTKRYGIVRGKSPFVFSRNVNLGIRAAGDDDVIVLNDDAILERPSGFTAMQEVANVAPEFGIISSSCNNVGNVDQHPRSRAPLLREESRMVCFVCVLIPRRTINEVGPLDERFVDYGLDDDDYCLRVRNAGLKIGIFDGCFVDHHKLKSTYRGESPTNSTPGDFRPNMRRFIEKWAVDNRGLGREQSPFGNLFPEVGA